MNAWVEGNCILVRVDYKAVPACKSVPGGRWDPDRRVWYYAASETNAHKLSQALANWLEKTDPEFLRLAGAGSGLSLDSPRLPSGAAEPPPLVKSPPWKHQCHGYQLIKKQKATMLAWDMGTGKSRVVVDSVVNLNLKRTLILCPKAVVAVWPTQFSKHAAKPVTVIVEEGGTVAQRVLKISQVMARCDRRDLPYVVVVNYEAAWRSLLSELIRQTFWDLMVLDESHRIKAAGGVQSQFCHRISGRAAKRVCLTGTPMPHSPLDVYGQYRFLDASIFGTNIALMRARYAIMGGAMNREEVGYQNIDELNAKFFTIAHRIKKRDVLDLPPVTHQSVRVTLGDEAWRVYLSLAAEFLADVEGGTITASNALVRLLRFQQVTGGAVNDDQGHTHIIDTAKATALETLIEGIDAAEPIVVFGRFSADLKAARLAAEKCGRIALELSGARNELAEWQADTRGSVLVVQIQSGGVGIDLTRAAYAVYYSLGFSLGEYEQSLARLDRPGQTRPVSYYHLVANKTIDAVVYGALRKRADVIKSILEIGVLPDGNDDEAQQPLAAQAAC